MPIGVVCAQLLHAAGESGPAEPGTYALVVSAANEAELLKHEDELLRLGVPIASIREPDAPYCGALMAIGIRPMPKRSLPKFLKKLPLFGREKAPVRTDIKSD